MPQELSLKLVELYSQIDDSAYRQLLELEHRTLVLPLSRENGELIQAIMRAKGALTRGLKLSSSEEDILRHCSAEAAALAQRWHEQGQAPFNLIVTDLDETLRFRQETEIEIPAATTKILRELLNNFPELVLVINTARSLEHVRGLSTQLLGAKRADSGRVVVIYEGGAGVFIASQGRQSHIPLYRELPTQVLDILERVRLRLPSACQTLMNCPCWDYRLQVDEFNLTLKPSYPKGSAEALKVAQRLLDILIDILAEVLGEIAAQPAEHWRQAIRAQFLPEKPPANAVLPESSLLKQLKLSFYPGDAAVLSAQGLDKGKGLKRAVEALAIKAPAMLALGDSGQDLPIFELLDQNGWGQVTCPEGASTEVKDWIAQHKGYVYPQGQAEVVLQAAYALKRLSQQPG